MVKERFDSSPRAFGYGLYGDNLNQTFLKKIYLSAKRLVKLFSFYNGNSEFWGRND